MPNNDDNICPIAPKTSCNSIPKCQNHNCNSYRGCPKNLNCSGNSTISPEIRCIPEPWNGNIEDSKIIFVGLNPGCDPNQYYPFENMIVQGNFVLRNGKSFSSGNNASVEDYFENRFSNSYDKKKKGFYHDTWNSLPKKWIRYWDYIHKVASSMLSKSSLGAGQDYACTEIIRCKSRNIRLINSQCYNICAEKYFNSTLNLTQNAQLLVFVGHNKNMISAINNCGKITCNGSNINNITNHIKYSYSFGHSKKCLPAVFIPHPNSFEKRPTSGFKKLNVIVALSDGSQVR